MIEENGEKKVTNLLELAGIEPEEELFVSRPVIVYKLSDYEGPLDLLLTLVKAAEIDIEDIFVSDVTRQYIDIIKNTPKEEFDFEYAGEFIIMAAELVYIKSLRALPVAEDEINEEDEIELKKQNLILKMKEYAILKEQSTKLGALETINRFEREPIFTEDDYRVSLTNLSLSKLVEAYARVLANSDKLKQSEMPKTVMREKFSVSDQMNNIRERLTVEKSFSFYSLFTPDFDKNDIVTTFLAVLELMKYQRLKAVQEENFGEIMLYAVEGATDAPIVFEEDDNGEY